MKYVCLDKVVEILKQRYEISDKVIDKVKQLPFVEVKEDKQNEQMDT